VQIRPFSTIYDEFWKLWVWWNVRVKNWSYDYDYYDYYSTATTIN